MFAVADGMRHASEQCELTTFGRPRRRAASARVVREAADKPHYACGVQTSRLVGLASVPCPHKAMLTSYASNAKHRSVGTLVALHICFELRCSGAVRKVSVRQALQAALGDFTNTGFNVHYQAVSMYDSSVGRLFWAALGASVVALQMPLASAQNVVFQPQRAKASLCNPRECVDFQLVLADFGVFPYGQVIECAPFQASTGLNDMPPTAATSAEALLKDHGTRNEEQPCSRGRQNNAIIGSRRSTERAVGHQSRWCTSHAGHSQRRLPQPELYS